MDDEKLNYVIDMIKDMDLENKLRLAICMCDNYSHTNLQIQLYFLLELMILKFLMEKLKILSNSIKLIYKRL